jgi:hypothetical protein
MLPVQTNLVTFKVVEPLNADTARVFRGLLSCTGHHREPKAPTGRWGGRALGHAVQRFSPMSCCTVSVGSLEVYLRQFCLGLPAGPYAGKPPLRAAWELEERAQRKPGVNTLLRCVLPLGLADERG